MRTSCQSSQLESAARRRRSARRLRCWDGRDGRRTAAARSASRSSAALARREGPGDGAPRRLLAAASRPRLTPACGKRAPLSALLAAHLLCSRCKLSRKGDHSTAGPLSSSILGAATDVSPCSSCAVRCICCRPRALPPRSSGARWRARSGVQMQRLKLHCLSLSRRGRTDYIQYCTPLQQQVQRYDISGCSILG